MKRPRKTLVAGIGNELRRDDASGLLAVRLARAEYKPRKTAGATAVDFIETNSPPDLLDIIGGYSRLILLDAVKLKGKTTIPKNGILILTGPELFKGAVRKFQSRTDTHGLGVMETLEIYESLGKKIPEIIFIGIPAKNTGPGERLSRQTEQGIKASAEYLLREI